MGNIKHNDELLRVHDDGFDVVFNCDNKHQNGVSYHAEKNGKKTKIDPEYAMAALVKKVSDGGGWPEDMPIPSEGGYGYTENDEQAESEIIHKINEKYLPETEECRWPEDMPVPSVGGYGYTESGEQTVITWDGDTEGKVSVRDVLYKISDSTPSQTDLVGAIMTSKTSPNGYIPDTQRTISQTDIVSLDGGFVVGADVACICVQTAGLQYMGETFTETGLYFARFEDAESVPDVTLVTYVSSLTYGGDTVHKIDEKYLPTSGGVMVVEVDYDGEQFVSTKTVDEVKNAMLTMPVIGIAKIMGEFKAVGIFSWLDESADPTFDASSPVMTVTSYTASPDDYQQVLARTLPLIAVSDGEFVINA